MKRFLAAFLGIVVIISLFSVSVSVYAVPLPPTVFYGTVTAGGVKAPDGTAVTAEINGIQYAQNTTSGGKYGYDGMFRILPDDVDTLEKEGWADGDQLDFYVNGVKADQVVIFKNNEYLAGESYRLNLAVSYLATPAPTETSTPTVTGTHTANLTPTITKTPTATLTPTHTPPMIPPISGQFPLCPSPGVGVAVLGGDRGEVGLGVSLVVGVEVIVGVLVGV